MTTIYVPELRQIAADTRGDGSWWLAASRALDALMDRLRRDELVDDGPKGDFAEAVWAAPNLAAKAARLNDDRSALMGRVRQLRQRLAEDAGDPTAVASVAQELGEIARAEEHYHRQANELVWDSVSRDIGGE